MVSVRSELTVATILVVDDDSLVIDLLGNALTRAGHAVLPAGTGQAAMELGVRDRPALVLLDLKLPDSDGLTVFRALRQHVPEIIGVVMTGFGSVPHAVESLKNGVADYVEKPFHVGMLVETVNGLLTSRESDADPPVSDFDGMVGTSAAMRGVFSKIVAIAAVDHPVLILGETGTGKELAARSLHRRSPRASGPFVAVNISAIPLQLFEDTIFGHERGAYTDAREPRAGCFEEAAGGTLFLDEVGELPWEGQAKLLRVLENREVRRLGSSRSRQIDVRVVAATNSPLEETVRRGTFRADLFWRLSALSIHMPPLRERKEDLPLLVNYCLRRFGPELGVSSPAVSEGALKRLHEYSWPGNVRELQHCLLEALLIAGGRLVDVHHLAEAVRLPNHAAHLHPPGLPSVGLRETLEAATAALEGQLIDEALRSHETLAAAAHALGIDTKTLYLKRLRYGLFSADKPSRK